MGSRIEAAKLRHGIDIWEGAPGSGKSYGAVDRLCKAIIWLRRPVYTNLPLRMRVLRRYLVQKTGDAMAARYVQQVNRDHFYRFVKRNELFAEMQEQKTALGWPRGEIEREFERQHGPNLTHGERAQWFHPGSIFIFDEFHRWADQRFQKDEDPAFLTYATMHRHHIHWIMLLTQDRMQISLPWRRNMATLYHCSDKRRLPFMFGMKLPMAAFAYEEYPGELVKDARDLKQVQPTNVDVIVPAFSGGTIFRLYDSYTHMGGARRLQMKINEVRDQVEGQTQTKQEEPDTMAKKKGKLRWVKYGAFAGVGALAVAVAPPACSPEQLEPTARAAAESSGAPPAASERLEQKERETFRATVEQRAGRRIQAPPDGPAGAIGTERAPAEPRIQGPPLVTVAGDGYVVADGKVVHRGASVREWKLVGVSVVDGESAWMRHGHLVSVPLGVQLETVAAPDPEPSAGDGSGRDRDPPGNREPGRRGSVAGGAAGGGGEGSRQGDSDITSDGRADGARDESVGHRGRDGDPGTRSGGAELRGEVPEGAGGTDPSGDGGASR